MTGHVSTQTTTPKAIVWTDLPNGGANETFGGQKVRIYYAYVRQIDAGLTVGLGIPTYVRIYVTLTELPDKIILCQAGGPNTLDVDVGKHYFAEWKGCLDLPGGSQIIFDPHIQVASQSPYGLVLYDFL